MHSAFRLRLKVILVGIIPNEKLVTTFLCLVKLDGRNKSAIIIVEMIVIVVGIAVWKERNGMWEEDQADD
jgi:hypothetical protein